MIKIIITQENTKQGEKMSEPRYGAGDFVNKSDRIVDRINNPKWQNYRHASAKSDSNKNSNAEFAANVWSVMDEIGNLLITKQGDYGPGNVNNAFGGPMNGLMVRIGDKFERLKNLFGTGSTPNHESIEDSFKDMANYAVIALMVERGLWPND